VLHVSMTEYCKQAVRHNEQGKLVCIHSAAASETTPGRSGGVVDKLNENL